MNDGIGRNLTESLYKLLSRARENKLYNPFIKHLGISPSHNNFRDFANGVRKDFPLTSLHKLANMFGYEVKIHFVKKNEDVYKIQDESTKDVLDNMEQILIQLEEKVQREKLLKEQKQQEKIDRQKTKNEERASASLTANFGINDDDISSFVDTSDLNLGDTFQSNLFATTEHININNK